MKLSALSSVPAASSDDVADSTGKQFRPVGHRRLAAVVVTVLLAVGLIFFLLAFASARAELPMSRWPVDGLLLLAVFFGLYVIYQERQIYHMQMKSTEQQEVFRLIGEHAADMIAVVEAGGKRIYNSPSYQKTLGYSPEELSDTGSSEQIHPDDRRFVAEAAQQSRLTGAGRKLEYRFRHKDGSWHVLESTASVIRNGRGEPDKFVIINRDITDRRDAEKALRETQGRQVQKMEAVGRLSGGIAHDFNNLLGIIIGYTEVLEEQVPPGHPLHKGIQEIKKAGERGAALTRQLLAFSRQQVMEPKVLDLNAVVTDVESLLRRAIGEDIELTTKMDPNLGRVAADQGQLDQVIMNLAVNARDAMPQGGKLSIETSNLDLDAELARQRPYVIPGPYVRLVVSDTGTGIDPETQTHIFEPFFSTKERGKGTGLGLATVYGVVKQSNGYIWVESERGKGTTFIICLPRVDGAPKASGVREFLPDFRHKGETVLVVEDEDSLRGLTRDLLVQNGFEVLEAESGARALETAARYHGPIHLLLSDVVMPGMSGPVLAAKLAESRPETKILFMSGYTEYAVAQHGVQNTEVQLLVKPYTRSTLLRKVHVALDSKAATMEIPKPATVEIPKPAA